MHLNLKDSNTILKSHKLYKLSLLFLMAGIILLLISLSKCSVKEPELSPADNYIKEQIKLIGEQNLALQSKIDSLSLKVSQYNVRLEKLSKTKTEIRYIYENKLTEIDNLYTTGIIKEFNIIFSKSNRK